MCFKITPVIFFNLKLKNTIILVFFEGFFMLFNIVFQLFPLISHEIIVNRIFSNFTTINQIYFHNDETITLFVLQLTVFGVENRMFI